MIRMLWGILSLLLLFCFSCATLPSKPTVVEGAPTTRSFIIVIDPGHDLSNAGTTGVRFIDEVHYNDALALAVQKHLESSGRFQAYLTRAPEQNKSLRERIDAAKKLGANLFLSIHHDSAQEKYLQKIEKNGKSGWKTKTHLQGYSLFVSSENAHYTDSIRFATLLGEELRKIGRIPSLHHAERIAGESHELLNPEKGIYRYDTLAVLQKTAMPAVLLEAGLIVDSADEAYLRDARNQQQMAEAISRAIHRFWF
jgi:N-acetylmuramoyl-L-alanine amidase